MKKSWIKKCLRCGKEFSRKGKYVRYCRACNKSRKAQKHKNSLTKIKRQIFYLIRKSEYIHPICKEKIINEIKNKKTLDINHHHYR